MNFQKRKQIILEKLNLVGEVDIKLLAAELDISEITMRRDLNQLAADGLLYRTHGGAMKVDPVHTLYGNIYSSTLFVIILLVSIGCTLQKFTILNLYKSFREHDYTYIAESDLKLYPILKKTFFEK